MVLRSLVVPEGDRQAHGRVQVVTGLDVVILGRPRKATASHRVHPRHRLRHSVAILGHPQRTTAKRAVHGATIEWTMLRSSAALEDDRQFGLDVVGRGVLIVAILSCLGRQPPDPKCPYWRRPVPARCDPRLPWGRPPPVLGPSHTYLPSRLPSAAPEGNRPNQSGRVIGLAAVVAILVPPGGRTPVPPRCRRPRGRAGCDSRSPQKATARR